ncbi:MAG: hypothetical protein HN580_02065 [Deltaproteobacteria bacterium]|nr:hypothetical protein [Deltaproteobacteria bacterium]
MKKKSQRYIATFFCVVLFLMLLRPIAGQALDRRKPQFQAESSYLIFPMPIALPGVGEMVVVTVLAGNIAGTNMDAYVLGISGDAEGYAGEFGDIHILPETLIFGVFSHNLNKVTFNNYASRGMDSDPDDYTLVEQTQFEGLEAKLTLTLFERRFELFGVQYNQEITTSRILDSGGNLIADLSPANQSESKTTTYGSVIDYTDDRQDPRVGARLEVSRSKTPTDDPDAPEFNVWDSNLTVYIPVGKISTFALNYFQSDAEVTREGQTDRTVLEQELGIECFGNSECETARDNLVQNNWASNKYGTATSLGGDERLRGYPFGRYKGAHVRFYGAEFRWNISEETKPFNWFIWKDIRTGTQVAFFYETGTVADTEEDLGTIYRSNYGIGFRLVTASGFVYRPEVALGEEGVAASITFNYPW